MKKYILTTAVWALAFAANAQNELYNNGALVYIGNAAFVKVNGSVTNTGTGADLQNNGSLIVTGNLTNDQVMSAYTGKLVLGGTTTQTVGGASPFLTSDLEINNPAGIALNAGLKVNDTCSFINGMVMAGNATSPLWFTSSGTYTGASDAGHVDGYVVKEGTGNFSYPVGDAAKYQKTDINLASNAAGMRVRYYGADAGSGSFVTTGAEPVALVSYNSREYWDISPLSAASGTVTIFWDGYKDAFANPVGERKVAHKSGADWANEGATATGTSAAGSVTSDTVSSWSPFTMGSTGSVLPLTWIAVSASRDAQGLAAVKWQVSEAGVKGYTIERSADAAMFSSIGSLPGKGDGTNSYAFTDTRPLKGHSYYRIRQTDLDGKYTWSEIISLSGNGAVSLSAYPTLFAATVTVISPIDQQAVLLNGQGIPVLKIRLQRGQNTLRTGALPQGIYILKAESGMPVKLTRQ